MPRWTKPRMTGSKKRSPVPDSLSEEQVIARARQVMSETPSGNTIDNAWMPSDGTILYIPPSMTHNDASQMIFPNSNNPYGKLINKHRFIRISFHHYHPPSLNIEAHTVPSNSQIAVLKDLAKGYSIYYDLSLVPSKNEWFTTGSGFKDFIRSVNEMRDAR